MPLPEHLKRYAIEKILKVSFKFPSRYALPVPLMRNSMNLASKSLAVHEGVQINRTTLGGCPAERFILFPDKPSEKVILHIHGGAFFLGGLDTHRALASQLTAQTGITTFTLDYPLAPEYRYPQAVQAIRNAYMDLIKIGFEAKDIIFSGDSCGGNLVLAAAISLRDDKIILPSQLVLMSPFLDLTLSGESIQTNKKLDAMLSHELLEQGGSYYVDGLSRDNPLVSPLFADLSNLPPTLVQVGSKEILLDDANRFKELADLAGNVVELSIYPGMWHVFQLFTPWTEAAEQALAEIRDFIQRHG